MKISSYQMQWRGMKTMYHQQSQLSEIQEKISKGKNFLQPADDPYASTQSLQIRQYIGRVDQYNTNADFVKTQLDMTEQSLSAYQDVLTRLNDLTLQIANDTYNDKDLRIVQQEVKELLNSTLSLANTKDTFGRTIFSGYTQGVNTVSKSEQGEYQYNGDLGRRMAFIGASSTVPQNKHAQEIFFGLATSHVNVDSIQSLAQHTFSPNDIQNLTSLTLNGQTTYLYSDQISVSNPSKSAQSVYNAIMASPDLGLSPTIVSAEIDFGQYISGFPANLVGNELEINDVSIEGTINDVDDLANAINAQSSLTGVVAVRDNAQGLSLNAIDGRNIELDYKAVTTAFQFDQNLAGAAATLEVVGAVGVTSVNDFTFDYNSLGDTNVVVLNELSPTISIKNSSDIQVSSKYSLYGHADGAVSLYSHALGSFVLENVSATDPIEYSGFSIQLDSPPTLESQMSFNIDRESSHDIFNAMERFVEFLGDASAYNKKDEVRLMLETIDSGFSKANQVIAEVGASMNVIDSQVNINKEMVLQSMQVLSSIEDLDLTKAISDFSFQKIAIEAAQSSYVQMQGLSLFKYM